jgi:hypothetical protein
MVLLGGKGKRRVERMGKVGRVGRMGREKGERVRRLNSIAHALRTPHSALYNLYLPPHSLPSQL